MLVDTDRFADQMLVPVSTHAPGVMLHEVRVAEGVAPVAGVGPPGPGGGGVVDPLADDDDMPAMAPDEVIPQMRLYDHPARAGADAADAAEAATQAVGAPTPAARDDTVDAAETYYATTGVFLSPSCRGTAVTLSAASSREASTG